MSRPGEGRSLEYETWESAAASFKSGRLTKAVIAVGSLEQHGPHLPLSTDSMIASYVAREVCRKSPSTFLIPTLSFGCSGEHVGFPGTISLSVETMLGTLEDISKSILRSGVKRLFMVNGHGGNRAVIDSAISSLRDSTPDLRVYSFTVLDVARPKFDEIRRSGRRLVGHADELETSMMLAISPELVLSKRAVKEEPRLPKGLSFEPDDLAKISFGWRTKAISRSGVLGDPLHASRDRGKVLLEEAVKIISALVKSL